MTQQDWQLYFSSLAAQHRLIRHTSTDRHFFRCELDEFFAGFRSKVHFPALIMESTLIDVEGQPTNRQLLRTLAIIVAQDHTRDDWNDIAAALADCETIGLDILGRLQMDIAAGTVPSLTSTRLTDIHGEPIANGPGRYVGWRLEFVVQEPLCMYHPNNWTHENN